MFSIIGAFFSSWFNYFWIAGIVVLATVVGVLWLQLNSAKASLDAEKINVERLTAKTVAQQIVIDGKQDAIEELERTNTELAKQSAELAATIEEIKNVPEAHDGPIAPVLDGTLRRLSGDGVRVKSKRPAKNPTGKR